jgi:DnaJ-class molecular chaperone
MKCPFDNNCDGLTVEKIAIYCFSCDRLEFDGRVWEPTKDKKPIIQKKCPACKGRGLATKFYELVLCPMCHGTGLVEDKGTDE